VARTFFLDTVLFQNILINNIWALTVSVNRNQSTSIISRHSV